MITVLAGGVGAARLLVGLAAAVDPTGITAIVNTGDDTVLHGLHVSPDLDTVTYTLADAINPSTGWGLAGETWAAMEALERYASVRPEGSGAAATWFRLGDRDLATHLYRTHRLREGASLTEVTAEIGAAWGVRSRLLPMSDEPAPTLITVAGLGEIGFQDYFVGHRHAVEVTSVRFANEHAEPTAAALAAIEEAEVVIVAPSNPIVSIGPLLAFPALRRALGAKRDRVVAVSPIVAGAALKGPADRMLVELGHEASVAGVAQLYRDVASVLVIDEADRERAAAVEALGLGALVTPTVMSTPAISAHLCRTMLDAMGAGR